MRDEVFRTQIRRALSLTVRRLREKVDITQESLANKSGVDRGHMGTLERAESTPTLETVYMILPVLRITFPRFAVLFEESLRNVRKQSRRK